MFRWIRRRNTPNNLVANARANYRPGYETLEDRSLLAAPVIDPIANITTLPTNKSIIQHITASDSDNDALTYTVTSSNAAIVPELHRTNPYLRLEVSYTQAGQTTPKTGVMIFEMLRDVAPATVDRISTLVNQGFYNNLTFHRLAFNGTQPFVIQGGDPLGTGAGGSGVDFDDEFNVNAIFTGNGQLAMAKSADDTNDSQFFITFGPQRHLDFNHTIFGQLVRGFDIRDEIINVPKDTLDPSRPAQTVRINSATFVENRTDAVITLRSTAAATGTVTVQVNDGTETVQRQFTVTTVTDSVNDPPFLGPVGNQRTTEGTTVTIPLTATDIENDAVDFTAVEVKANAADPNRVTIAPITDNQIRVTPVNGFTGTVQLRVGVKPDGAAGDPVDSQLITLTVDPRPLQPPPVDPNLPANQRFVAQVYLQVLEREVDPTGLAHFSGLLDQGMPRAQVVQIIEDSQEHLVKLVNELYQDFLGRDADAAGLTSHTRFLREGGNIDDLRENILSSPEYIASKVDESDQPAAQVSDYLAAVYQDVMGRAIDTAGEQAYTRMLGSGFTRAQMIETLLDTEEGRRRKANQLYQQVLERAGDTNGLNAASSVLDVGATEEALLRDMVLSPEAELVVSRPR